MRFRTCPCPKPSASWCCLYLECIKVSMKACTSHNSCIPSFCAASRTWVGENYPVDTHLQYAPAYTYSIKICAFTNSNASTHTHTRSGVYDAGAYLAGSAALGKGRAGWRGSTAALLALLGCVRMP